MNLTEYGFVPEMMPEEAGDALPARVTAVHKERYELICECGEVSARLKTKEYYGGTEEFPTVGDFVLIRYVESGDSLIVRTLPRQTFFSRKDPSPGRGEQAVAANFDYVFIMQSLNQNFNTNRLERYLTLAWQSGAVPVVILTKADLVEDSSSYVEAVEKVAIGVKVHVVSSQNGFGLETLEAYMQPGKTVTFLGSSGVGKSSLVNALAGEPIMAVSEIREADGRGRHTTTHRQLIKMKNGSMIIDTPGMRELGMWDVTEGLGEAFTDVEQFLGRCRFSDCKHQSEPGCVIKEAIADGALSLERWESYRKLKSEARYSDDKMGFLRQKQLRNKSIAKMSRQRKNIDKSGRGS